MGGVLLIQGISYNEVILESSPIGYWKLDETSGTTAADSSTNSNDGTYTGPYFRLDNDSIVASLASSLYQNNENGIISTGRADTFVDILNSVSGGHPFTDIANNNSYTLEAWIQTGQKTNDEEAGYYGDVTIMELRRQGATGVAFNMSLVNGFLSIGRVTNSGNSERHVDTTDLSDNVPHHVAVVVNVNAIEFYVDGSLSSSATFTTAISDASVGSNNCNLALGIRNSSDGDREFGGWVGMLGACAIYGTNLSSTTIADHYAAGQGQPAVIDRGGYAAAVTLDGPVSWWRLGEVNGSTVAVDSGSNAYNGAYEISGTSDVGQVPLIMDNTRGYDRSGGNNLVDILDSVAGGHPFTNMGNSDFSLEAWIYMRGTPGSGGGWWPGNVIIELRTQQGSGSHTSFSWGIESPWRLVCGMADNYVSNNEKAESVNNVFSPGTNEIYHVVTTCEVIGAGPATRNWRMFVNGSEVTVGTNATFTTVTGDVSVGSTTCNMQIGWRSRDGGQKDSNAFNGWIDEVAIYDKCLSPARVLAHYNAGVA